MSTMIDVTTAASMLDVSDSMFRVYLRAGCFKTAKKVRGTRWMVDAVEVQHIIDGKVQPDFTGAWEKVHGKED